jgi:UDP-2-acetamido-2-deoxy-ribo-hexuluronate aminotransferase
MEKIQMVDLLRQYLKIKPEIDSAIQEVIDSTAFIRGPKVVSFEKELASYLGVKHVIACANGTDALQIALMVFDLKPGNEVITPSFTFIATVEVIALLGLKPVFAEVDKDSFNIDPKDIEKKISPMTKAILPVHLFGQSADMDAIMSIAKKHNLFVIEDACQTTGADFTSSTGKTQKAGTIGNVGCASFFPSKNLGCFGDGGALFTNDDTLAEKIRVVTNHGMKVRYYHDEIGVNSRLDSIQAAILSIKLKKLNAYNEARQQAAAFYDKELSSVKGIKVPVRFSKSKHIFHQYTLKLENVDREALRMHLERKGIPAMIYYPVPIHLQKAYKIYGYKEGDLPVTEKLCEQVLSLPMHTELDNDQLQFICNEIKAFCKNS